jgi:hypothetical protein
MVESKYNKVSLNKLSYERCSVIKKHLVALRFNTFGAKSRRELNPFRAGIHKTSYDIFTIIVWVVAPCHTSERLAFCSCAYLKFDLKVFLANFVNVIREEKCIMEKK